MPVLQQKIDQELKRCREDIGTLPAVIEEDARTAITLRVTNFCGDLEDIIFGEKDERFVQSNRNLYLEFKRDILATAPDFRPFEGLNVSQYPRLVHGSRREPHGLEYIRQMIDG